MPLFMCTACGLVDNTAVSGYWARQLEAMDAGKPHEPLCSQCNPDIGKWHGQFERKLAEGYVADKSGHIYKPDEAAGYFKHMGPFKPVELPPAVNAKPAAASAIAQENTDA